VLPISVVFRRQIETQNAPYAEKDGNETAPDNIEGSTTVGGTDPTQTRLGGRVVHRLAASKRVVILDRIYGTLIHIAI
jgi:hypothetical protein